MLTRKIWAGFQPTKQINLLNMETITRPETTGADITDQDKSEALISLLDEYIDYLEKKVENLTISGVRLSLPSVDQIEKDIKSCYETKWSGCSQWCGSDDCSPDCANSSEYEELDRDKLKAVIERWRNECQRKSIADVADDRKNK